MKTGRNAPCPCGSGLKYKNCCLNRERKTPLYKKLLAGLVAVILTGGLIRAVIAFRSIEPSASTGPAKVWSEEHQHWH